MHLFILNYPVQYAKRLVTWLEGKRKCRCVVWIIKWALQIQCNLRVPFGANKVISEDWRKRDHRGIQRIYGSWYSFFILGKNFARPFELKQLPFPGSCSSYDKNYFFLISNGEKWVWRKVFERFITILIVSDDIIGVLLFQFVSIFKGLDCKFEAWL